jgi:outer membrane protein OmpA-like peptidoglycan-associated protein
MRALILKPMATAFAAALLLGACASTPDGPPAAVVQLQNELMRVESDARIPPHADDELVEARRAVDALLLGYDDMDDEAYAHNVYIADRLIKVAEAEGLAGYAEARTRELGTEREALLIEARDRDADAALALAEQERRNAELARADASRARAEAERAYVALETMQARLADLETKRTERGLVVTLGDVLFETDRAELKPGSERTLDELVAALRESPNASVAIEGHTDSTASHAYNQSLSERRAAAVRAYLVAKGIDGTRISARGLGEEFPVASNADAAGRQQNRRVELVIQDRPLVVVEDDE